MKKYRVVSNFFLPLQKLADLKVAVYCILVATIFWIFSALNKEYDASISYPVEWDFDLDKYIAVNTLPKYIQMNVNGLGWNLLKVNSKIGLNALSLKINDPAIVKSLPGDYFSNQIAEALDQLQLNYIIDDTLFFNIDYRATQLFSIYIDSLNINLKKDYRIVSAILYDTKKVDIEGPKKMLEAMSKDSFFVSIIEKNIDSDFDNETPIQLEHYKLMRSQPQIIKVKFKVQKFIMQEIELPVSFTSHELFRNASLKDSLFTVYYSIQEKFKDSVSIDMLTVKADIDSLNPTDSTINLRLETHSKFITNPYLEFPKQKIYYK